MLTETWMDIWVKMMSPPRHPGQGHVLFAEFDVQLLYFPCKFKEMGEIQD